MGRSLAGAGQSAHVDSFKSAQLFKNLAQPHLDSGRFSRSSAQAARHELSLA